MGQSFLQFSDEGKTMQSISWKKPTYHLIYESKRVYDDTDLILAQDWVLTGKLFGRGEARKFEARF